MATPDEFDGWVRYAILEAKEVYGINVFPKGKSLLKFGKTDNADSAQKTTLMKLNATTFNETYLSANSINKVSSSSTNDGATITIEGHTIDSAGNLTFVVQSIALTGQTAATLATPLARATRAFNSDSTTLAGDVYVHETDTLSSGVPQTGAKIHLVIAAGEQQSEKAASAVSATDCYFVTEIEGGLERGNVSANADFALEVKLQSGVFRRRWGTTLRSAGTSTAYRQLRPFLIVPPNADFRLVAISDTDNTTISGYTNGPLCRVL